MTNLGKISDALCDIAEAINQIKDAMRQITDAICEAIPALIDVISDVMRAGKKQKRPRYLPVRYICAADRRPDRRPPVHHIRSALPHRDRRPRRKGEVY